MRNRPNFCPETIPPPGGGFNGSDISGFGPHVIALDGWSERGHISGAGVGMPVTHTLTENSTSSSAMRTSRARLGRGLEVPSRLTCSNDTPPDPLLMSRRVMVPKSNGRLQRAN